MVLILTVTQDLIQGLQIHINGVLLQTQMGLEQELLVVVTFVEVHAQVVIIVQEHVVL